MRRDALEPASGWTRRRAAGLARSFAPLGIPMIVAAALLACASPASAAFIHDTASESFGRDGTSATTIGSTENQQDAVIAGLNPNNDTLYVLDRGDQVVRAFNVPNATTHTALGGFFPAPTGDISNGLSLGAGAAVDTTTGNPSSGNVYVVNGHTHALIAFAPNGEFLYHKTVNASPCGAGVDTAGRVWITDSVNNQLTEYDGATGEPLGGTISTAGPGTQEGGCNLVFDPKTNDLYVQVPWGGGVLYRFTAASNYKEWTPLEYTSGPLALDPTYGNIFTANGSGGGIAVLEPNGDTWEHFGQFTSSVAVAANGTVYASNNRIQQIEVYPARILADAVTNQPQGPAGITRTGADLSGIVKPVGGPAVTECKFQVAPVSDSSYSGADSHAYSCEPDASVTGFTAETPVTAAASGLTNDTEYHVRLAVTNETGVNYSTAKVFQTDGAVADLETAPPTNITTTGAEFNGRLDTEGLSTEYRFEYGASETFGLETPGGDAGNSPGLGAVPPIAVEGLHPDTTYFYRIVASNENGTTVRGPVRKFATASPPKFNSVFSSHVLATSADLSARVATFGEDTTYQFEYGTTTELGQVAPAPPGTIPGSSSVQSAEVHLTGLLSTVYYFRVKATNKWGTTASDFQSFNFYPPSCPNHAVRQQTNSSYLPDCRAYELVSPPEAGTTILFPAGPQRPYASSPPRVAFVGQFGEIPGATKSPPDTVGDLYVSTRQPGGWTTKYVGPSANEFTCAGGRPQRAVGGPPTIQNDVVASPDLGLVADWDLGNAATCIEHSQGDETTSFLPTGELSGEEPSNAPYVWSTENGESRGQFPSPVARVPGWEEEFTCPETTSSQAASENCTTYVAVSEEMNHFVFSTQSGIFGGEGAIETAPGSAYDNNTKENTLSLISRQEGGEPIEQESPENGGPQELIQFPFVSTDGSHILMGTKVHEQCVQTAWPGSPPCPYIAQPTHLYMRVNDAVSYDVSQVPVKYVGATPSGNRVYFTTNQQLAAEDTDSNVDLYMWSDTGASSGLTLISKGPGGAGNRESCSADWTSGCDAETYRDDALVLATGSRGGLGSLAWSWEQKGYPAPLGDVPGYTDNAVAANGDIVFYSPDLLDGSNGRLGGINVYEYHDGAPQYVVTLEDKPYCIKPSLGDFRNSFAAACSNGALGRIQVTPDGRFLAFVTTSRLTSFNNEGVGEMYRFDMQTHTLVCVSCRPDGEPPTDSVFASLGGRFISDDGRVFFTTADPLVANDTNTGVKELKILTNTLFLRAGWDVYEYVDGRPQLITPGTSSESSTFGFASESTPGLYGVSADGIDVYFGSQEPLVPQDNNGVGSVRFYDARTNGGIAVIPDQTPCRAADECHGPSSQAPEVIPSGTGASLGQGGNLVRKKHVKKKVRKKAGRKHKQRRGKHVHRHSKGGQRR